MDIKKDKYYGMRKELEEQRIRIDRKYLKEDELKQLMRRVDSIQKYFDEHGVDYVRVEV